MNLDELFIAENTFPERQFKTKYSFFSYLSFDNIFSEDFIESLLSFVMNSDDTVINAVVIEPDCVDYYLKHFGIYGAFELGVESSAEEYLEIINVDPGNSPADAFIHRADRIVFFPRKGGWVLYGDRELEIVLCGFSNMSAKKDFATIFQCGIMNSPNEVIDYVKDNFINEELLKIFKEKLIANY